MGGNLRAALHWQKNPSAESVFSLAWGRRDKESCQIPIYLASESCPQALESESRPVLLTPPSAREREQSRPPIQRERVRQPCTLPRLLSSSFASFGWEQDASPIESSDSRGPHTWCPYTPTPFPFFLSSLSLYSFPPSPGTGKQPPVLPPPVHG